MEKNIKIGLIGTYRVGKMSFCYRHFHDHFYYDFSPTMLESYPKKMKFKEDFYNVEIISLYGDPEYFKFEYEKILQCNGFILAFSMIDVNTIHDLEIFYDKLSSILDSNNFIKILISTKYDLEEKFQITETKIEELCKKYQCNCFLTSSLTGLHCEESIRNICELILREGEKKNKKKCKFY